MDNSDSRKRPSDGEEESGVTKRSHNGSDNVHLKLLIPCDSAGAIIGRGGETINNLQATTGTTIQLSKGSEYYPGTMDRVCLVIGSVESVRRVNNFIMDKLLDKPDDNGPGSASEDREIKVRLLVPNSTVSMIIGKGGLHIRQIQLETSAYLQVSQKTKDGVLLERCITIAGTVSQCRDAVDMVLEKIVADPLSSSCPSVSYSGSHIPVPSANPTGSPFAATSNTPDNHGFGRPTPNIPHHPMFENIRLALRIDGYSDVASQDIVSALYTLASYGIVDLQSGFGSIGMMTPNAGGYPPSGGLTCARLAALLMGTGGSGFRATGRMRFGSGGSQAGENGFPGSSARSPPETTDAGVVGGSGGGYSRSSDGPSQNSVGQNAESSDYRSYPNEPAFYSGINSGWCPNLGLTTAQNLLGFYKNMETGTTGKSELLDASRPQMDSNTGYAQNESSNVSYNQSAATGNNSAGNPPANNSATSDQPFGSYGGGYNYYNSTSTGGAAAGSYYNSVSTYGENSAAAYTAAENGGQNSAGYETGQTTSTPNPNATSHTMEVAEILVGVIMGAGGKGIVEIQQYTGAKIEVSKKGVYAPGTTNRIVTITGAPVAVQTATYWIHHYIQTEEYRRANPHLNKQQTQQWGC